MRRALEERFFLRHGFLAQWPPPSKLEQFFSTERSRADTNDAAGGRTRTAAWFNPECSPVGDSGRVRPPRVRRCDPFSTSPPGIPWALSFPTLSHFLVSIRTRDTRSRLQRCPRLLYLSFPDTHGRGSSCGDYVANGLHCEAGNLALVKDDPAHVR